MCWSETGPSVDVRPGPFQLQPSGRTTILYARADDEHTWQITHCQDADGTWTNTAALIPLDPDVPATPTGGGPRVPAPLRPAEVALRATAQLDFTFPTLHLSPAATRQVVGVPTWIWIDAAWWQPRTATDADGGLTVTLTATPSRLTFDPGDGSATLSCTGPGTPFDPRTTRAWASSPTCGHTYTSAPRTRTLTARATITWTFTWTASDGTAGTLADLDITHTETVTPTAYTAVTD